MTIACDPNSELALRLTQLWNLVGRLKEQVDVFKGFYRAEATQVLYQLPVDVDAFFLRIARDAFTDSIVLQIAVVLDQSSSTLSLPKFVDRMAKEQIDGKLRWDKNEIRALQERIASIKREADSLLQARHQLIAHTSEAVTTGKDTLDNVTFDQAADATEQVIALLTDMHYAIHGVMPPELPMSHEGTDALDYLSECHKLQRIGRRESPLKFLSAR